MNSSDENNKKSNDESEKKKKPKEEPKEKSKDQAKDEPFPESEKKDEGKKEGPKKKEAKELPFPFREFTSEDWERHMTEKRDRKIRIKEQIAIIQKFLEKYPDIYDKNEKCSHCSGKGTVKKNRGVLSEKDEFFEDKCKHCKAGQKPIFKTYISEKPEQVKKRIIDALQEDGERRKKFFALLTEFNDKKTNVSKNLLNKYPELEKRGKITIMIQNLIKLILKEPSSNQRRLAKELTGMSSYWNKLDLDYHGYYKIIQNSKLAHNENFEKLKNYGQLSETEKIEAYKKNQLPYALYRLEDQRRLHFIKQLVRCIENDKEKYSFSEDQVSRLNYESKMILLHELKSKESLTVSDFLDEWKKNLANQLLQMNKIHDELLKDAIQEILYDGDPSNLLISIIESDGESFKRIEDDRGLTYDYKSGFFGNKDKVDLYYSKLTSISDDSTRWKEANKLADEDGFERIQKTIISFMNTNGGLIIIGVRDNRTTIGLENMKEIFYKKTGRNGSKKIEGISNGDYFDHFRLHIQEKLRNDKQPDIREHYVRDKIKVEIVDLSSISKSKKHLAIISVFKSDKANFLITKTERGFKETYYKRQKSESVILTGKELIQELANRNLISIK